MEFNLNVNPLKIKPKPIICNTSNVHNGEIRQINKSMKTAAKIINIPYLILLNGLVIPNEDIK